MVLAYPRQRPPGDSRRDRIRSLSDLIRVLSILPVVDNTCARARRHQPVLHDDHQRHPANELAEPTARSSNGNLRPDLGPDARRRYDRRCYCRVRRRPDGSRRRRFHGGRHGSRRHGVPTQHSPLGTVTRPVLIRSHGQRRMAEKKTKKKTRAPRKRRKPAGKSIGLTAKELLTTESPTAVEE